METDSIVIERPVVSAVVVALVAGVVYAGIQVAFDGGIAVVEMATFVAIFTVVYVGGNWMLREHILDDPGEAASDGEATVAEPTDTTE